MKRPSIVTTSIGVLTLLAIGAYVFGMSRLSSFAPAAKQGTEAALTDMASSQDGYTRSPYAKSNVIRTPGVPHLADTCDLPPWEPDPDAIPDLLPESTEHPLSVETVAQPSPHGGKLIYPRDLRSVPALPTPPMAVPGIPRSGEAFAPPPVSDDIYGSRLRSASARFAEHGELEPETDDADD